jgi:hypothetical protein
MLIYGILMIVVGAIMRIKAAKLVREMETEGDEEIKKGLAKSARRRKITGNIFIIVGVLAILAIIIFLAVVF